MHLLARSSALAILIAAATLATAGLATAEEPPSAMPCSYTHNDPPPGYDGPLYTAMHCENHSGATTSTTWAAPGDVQSVDVVLYGSGQATTAGGWVKADIELRSSKVLVFELGAAGGASSVHRDGELLLRAAGGDGAEGNYAAPGVRVSGSSPAGAPLPGAGGDGHFWVQWMHGWYSESEAPPQPQQPEPARRCAVPGLGGKRLGAARKALAAANCAAGRVRRAPARRARRGRVVSQSQKPGTVLPAGTAVDLVLGRRPYSGATPR